MYEYNILNLLEIFDKMNIIRVFQRNRYNFLLFARKQKYIQSIEDLQAELNVKKGQLLYVFEYLKLHPCKFVKQGDVLLYCDKRRNQDTKGKKPNFKDNSRAVEILRKDKTPMRWIEVIKDGELYFMYNRDRETLFVKSEVERLAHRKAGFTKDVVETTFKNANFKCQMCKADGNKVKLECDHWNPREKCGESNHNNAVCLCTNCNPRKNAKSAEEWMGKHFILNFYAISKQFGSWDEHKLYLLEYIKNLS